MKGITASLLTRRCAPGCHLELQRLLGNPPEQLQALAVPLARLVEGRQLSVHAVLSQHGDGLGVASIGVSCGEGEGGDWKQLLFPGFKEGRRQGLLSAPLPNQGT